MHSIRQCWTAEGFKFDDPIEVDETCIGGKKKNKHGNKKMNSGRGF